MSTKCHVYYILHNKGDVARIQGPPDSTHCIDTFEGESWGYDSGNTFCSISFNLAGRVEGWFNRGDLKVRMVPGPNSTTPSSFSINSHKDDVARLEGTPYRVIVPIRQTRASLQEERRSNRELGIKPDEDDEVIEDNISGLNNEDDRETWYFRGGTPSAAKNGAAACPKSWSTPRLVGPWWNSSQCRN